MKTITQILLFLLVYLVLILSSCKKECNEIKQNRKQILGEWEVVSFKKIIANVEEDLTSLYSDSCGCRLVFTEIFNNISSSANICYLKCSFQNTWNFVNHSDSSSIYSHPSFETTWRFDEFGTSIIWSMGGINNDTNYRIGMYPLTINISRNEVFSIKFIEKGSMMLKYYDNGSSASFMIFLNKIK